MGNFKIKEGVLDKLKSPCLTIDDSMEPLIEITQNHTVTKMDEYVINAVCEMDIDVDKERLVKALTDARSFYNEGYAAAKEKWKPPICVVGHDTSREIADLDLNIHNDNGLISNWRYLYNEPIAQKAVCFVKLVSENNKKDLKPKDIRKVSKNMERPIYDRVMMKWLKDHEKERKEYLEKEYKRFQELMKPAALDWCKYLINDIPFSDKCVVNISFEDKKEE